MDKYLRAAIFAGEQANKILLAGFKASEKKVTDKNRNAYVADLVTKYDFAAQKAILAIISKNFPNHSILSEEGINIENQSEYRWVIDPLDGTNNFSRGIPNFASSIALTKKNKIIVGVVGLPLENKIIYADQKRPTHQNGKKVKVSNSQELYRSLIAISMLRSKEALATGGKTFVKLIRGPVKPRIFGSVAAALAWTAAGKLDGVVFNHSNPWDITAGIFLVQRAGGKVSAVKGRFSLESEQLVASNKFLHKQLLEILC